MSSGRMKHVRRVPCVWSPRFISPSSFFCESRVVKSHECEPLTRGEKCDLTSTAHAIVNFWARLLLFHVSGQQNSKPRRIFPPPPPLSYFVPSFSLSPFLCFSWPKSNSWSVTKVNVLSIDPLSVTIWLNKTSLSLFSLPRLSLHNIILLCTKIPSASKRER